MRRYRRWLVGTVAVGLGILLVMSGAEAQQKAVNLAWNGEDPYDTPPHAGRKMQNLRAVAGGIPLLPGAEKYSRQKGYLR